MSNSTEHWIPVEDAAEILQVTTRQAHRYGEGPNARIRTRKAGRRVMFHQEDVEALAADLGVLSQPRPQRQRADLVPTGEMLDYIRERDRQLLDLQQQLNSAYAEAGRLTGLLEAQRSLLEDADGIRRRLAEIEAERDQLRSDLEAQRAELEAERALQQPWWRKLFGG
jgi:chromosome segregation ATPase